MNRRSFLISCAVGGSLLPPFGMAGEPGTIASQHPNMGDDGLVLKLDNTWAAAEQAGDLAALQRLLDDNFMLIDFDGTAYSKSGYLESISKTTFLSYEIANQTVRTWDDTGIVTGDWRATWTFDGKPDQGALRFIAIFVRRAENWLAIAESVAKA